MTEPQEGFYSTFENAAGNSVFIVRGPESGYISLKIRDDRLYVVVRGEPKGEYLVECFRDGVDSGALRPCMRTLVDLTGFIGTVDWKALLAVRSLAPWGKKDSGVSLIAYVVRNDMFGALIKIIRTLFLGSTHRMFDNFAAAIAWLESQNLTERS